MLFQMDKVKKEKTAHEEKKDGKEEQKKEVGKTKAPLQSSDSLDFDEMFDSQMKRLKSSDSLDDIFEDNLELLDEEGGAKKSEGEKSGPEDKTMKENGKKSSKSGPDEKASKKPESKGSTKKLQSMSSNLDECLKDPEQSCSPADLEDTVQSQLKRLHSFDSLDDVFMENVEALGGQDLTTVDEELETKKSSDDVKPAMEKVPEKKTKSEDAKEKSKEPKTSSAEKTNQTACEPPKDDESKNPPVEKYKTLGIDAPKERRKPVKFDNAKKKQEEEKKRQEAAKQKQEALKKAAAEPPKDLPKPVKKDDTKTRSSLKPVSSPPVQKEVPKEKTRETPKLKSIEPPKPVVEEPMGEESFEVHDVEGGRMVAGVKLPPRRKRPQLKVYRGSKWNPEPVQKAPEPEKKEKVKPRATEDTKPKQDAPPKAKTDAAAKEKPTKTPKQDVASTEKASKPDSVRNNKAPKSDSPSKAKPPKEDVKPKEDPKSTENTSKSDTAPKSKPPKAPSKEQQSGTSGDAAKPKSSAKDKAKKQKAPLVSKPSLSNLDECLHGPLQSSSSVDFDDTFQSQLKDDEESLGSLDDIFDLNVETLKHDQDTGNEKDNDKKKSTDGRKESKGRSAKAKEMKKEQEDDLTEPASKDVLTSRKDSVDLSQCLKKATLQSTDSIDFDETVTKQYKRLDSTDSLNDIFEDNVQALKDTGEEDEEVDKTETCKGEDKSRKQKDDDDDKDGAGGLSEGSSLGSQRSGGTKSGSGGKKSDGKTSKSGGGGPKDGEENNNGRKEKTHDGKLENIQEEETQNDETLGIQTESNVAHSEDTKPANVVVKTKANEVVSELQSKEMTAGTQPDGTVEIKPGRTVEMQPGETVETQPGGTVDMQPGGTVETHPGGTVEIQPGGTVEMQPGGTMEMQPGGTVELQPGGTVEMKPSETVETQGDGAGEMQPGETVETQSGETALEIQPGETEAESPGEALTETQPSEKMTEPQSDKTMAEILSFYISAEMQPGETTAETEPLETTADGSDETETHSNEMTKIRSGEETAETQSGENASETQNVTGAMQCEDASETHLKETPTEIQSGEQKHLNTQSSENTQSRESNHDGVSHSNSGGTDNKSNLSIQVLPISPTNKQEKSNNAETNKHNVPKVDILTPVTLCTSSAADWERCDIQMDMDQVSCAILTSSTSSADDNEIIEALEINVQRNAQISHNAIGSDENHGIEAQDTKVNGNSDSSVDEQMERSYDVIESADIESEITDDKGEIEVKKSQNTQQNLEETHDNVEITGPEVKKQDEEEEQVQDILVVHDELILEQTYDVVENTDVHEIDGDEKKVQETAREESEIDKSYAVVESADVEIEISQDEIQKSMKSCPSVQDDELKMEESRELLENNNVEGEQQKEDRESPVAKSDMERSYDVIESADVHKILDEVKESSKGCPLVKGEELKEQYNVKVTEKDEEKEGMGDTTKESDSGPYNAKVTEKDEEKEEVEQSYEHIESTDVENEKEKEPQENPIALEDDLKMKLLCEALDESSDVEKGNDEGNPNSQSEELKKLLCEAMDESVDEKEKAEGSPRAQSEERNIKDTPAVVRSPDIKETCANRAKENFTDISEMITGEEATILEENDDIKSQENLNTVDLEHDRSSEECKAKGEHQEQDPGDKEHHVEDITKGEKDEHGLTVPNPPLERKHSFAEIHNLEESNDETVPAIRRTVRDVVQISTPMNYDPETENIERVQRQVAATLGDGNMDGSTDTENIARVERQVAATLGDGNMDGSVDTENIERVQRQVAATLGDENMEDAEHIDHVEQQVAAEYGHQQEEECANDGVLPVGETVATSSETSHTSEAFLPTPEEVAMTTEDLGCALPRQISTDLSPLEEEVAITNEHLPGSTPMMTSMESMEPVTEAVALTTDHMSMSTGNVSMMMTPTTQELVGAFNEVEVRTMSHADDVTVTLQYRDDAEEVKKDADGDLLDIQKIINQEAPVEGKTQNKEGKHRGKGTWRYR